MKKTSDLPYFIYAIFFCFKFIKKLIILLIVNSKLINEMGIISNYLYKKWDLLFR